jgi:hypothetical protein
MGDSMSTIINATTTNGVVIQPDNSGSLVLQTNSGTTALTIDTSQNITTANKLASASMPTGSVLQVLQTVKTDTFSVTGGLTNDITGMSVSITPKFSTSKILVQVVVYAQNSSESGSFLTLVRGSTAICIGNAAGSRSRSSTGASYDTTGYHASALVVNHLDSPATTSSTTYKCQIAANSTSTTYVNRTAQDSDVAQIGRYASTITVMEIAA